jgi:acetolactate synthase-1/2/3 large subunit
MERMGISKIFGMPGAHILPVYDCLYDSSIDAVLAKHEQGAAFMAGGYSRVSGRIGACIATAGPGATNLVTGVANAYADRIPLLAITGETSTHIFGKGGLQESSGEGGSFNQATLFKEITDYARVVERTDYLPQVLNQAARCLLAPNPGPVLLSIPYNVQRELLPKIELDSLPKISNQSQVDQQLGQITYLVEFIKTAKQSVIVAGYGAIRSGAQQVIRQLSEDFGIPVATSLKGKGVVDENSPLALGSLGVTSSGKAYEFITQKSDLILFLGASFNERTSYLWDERLLQGKKIIQVDLDPQRLHRVYQADLAIQGDIKSVVVSTLQRLMEHDQRRQQVAIAPSNQEPGYRLFQSGFSLVEQFFQQLAKFVPNAKVFDDNIIFAQNFYQVTQGASYFPNSGISSLGHAIPAAIGAAFHQSGPMFAVLGDGGFQMCCMELMTAVNYNKPLNVVLFNNSTMGLIRKNQYQHYQQRYINCDFANPDFAVLAQSFGMNYKYVKNASDLDDLFQRFDLEGGLNLIEIVLDKDAFPNYSSKR